MRWMIVALLLAILLVDVGYKAWATRPYTVTGWALESSPNVLRVEFTNPGGGRASIDVPSVRLNDCYRRIGIGFKIPNECQP